MIAACMIQVWNIHINNLQNKNSYKCTRNLKNDTDIKHESECLQYKLFIGSFVQFKKTSDSQTIEYNGKCLIIRSPDF